jgi:hypothetical protein
LEIPFFLIILIPVKEVFILLFVQEVLALFVFLNDRTLNGFQAADNSTIKPILKSSESWFRQWFTTWRFNPPDYRVRDEGAYSAGKRFPGSNLSTSHGDRNGL